MLPDPYPITMRHAKRGARWAIARFEDGGFALYRRHPSNPSVWYSREAPIVQIVCGEIIPCWVRS